MKGMKHTLALAAALALSLSAAASADDHRGRGYRDNDRHTHAVPQRGNSKFRAQRRTIKRDVNRRNDRRFDRRFDRRDRKHWRAAKQARRHWRAQRRQDYRAARRHRHGNRICYADHRNERSIFGIWLDDVGLTVRERRYR